MLFNSHEFIFAFLPLVLMGWYALRRPMARLGFLTLASWFFYAWWDWRFLPLMLTSTTIDYGAGRLLVATDDERRRRVVLVTALSLNLALLGYFKYAGFFLTSMNGLGTAFGIGIDFPALHIVLPIGISFYTFNSMSYTIDVFRRQVHPAKSIVHYAAFVSMFPHLIAGPIVRYSTMEGQLQRLAPRLSPQLAASGLFFFACGLTKKLLVADTLAPHVDILFGRHQHLTLVSGWAASATRCSSTLTSRATPTWRSALHSCSASAFHRTSTHPTSRSTSRTSGGAGTCRSASGCATTCLSRWADRKAAAGGRFAISRSRCSWAVCGTARPGRSSSGGCSTASSWWCTVSAETTVSHRTGRS
jgi:hypothetical protein